MNYKNLNLCLGKIRSSVIGLGAPVITATQKSTFYCKGGHTSDNFDLSSEVPYCKACRTTTPKEFRPRIQKDDKRVC